MEVAAPCFDIRNPNTVYSLIGGFCSSSVNFHTIDDYGYEFMGDMVLKLDKINPQVTSRNVSAFSRWNRFNEAGQTLAKAQLERILFSNGLPKNVYEIASKAWLPSCIGDGSLTCDI